MISRNVNIEFMGGALVFPGGKLDPSDSMPRLRARCLGAAALDDEELAHRVAAVRETFEECGLVLACQTPSGPLVDGSRQAALVAHERSALIAGQISLLEMTERADLWLATDRLVPYSRWTTPEISPKRYATRFYLTPMPPGQGASHDGGETQSIAWLRPAQTVVDGDTGRSPVRFPTKHNLRLLAQSPSVRPALDAAHRRPMAMAMPVVERTPDGLVLRLKGHPIFGHQVDPFRPLVKKRSSSI